ncbi:uncharacterized protein LOC123689291 [Pieris rapae]|uniref:uncharacterized protein LOC123689291 n=1 Tax=Pieris rapae TaxID=64459 RepID=UPI001E27F810|nr:uncharacterized protein LOC123689291 [Pieris rapae]
MPRSIERTYTLLRLNYRVKSYLVFIEQTTNLSECWLSFISSPRNRRLTKNFDYKPNKNNGPKFTLPSYVLLDFLFCRICPIAVTYVDNKIQTNFNSRFKSVIFVCLKILISKIFHLLYRVTYSGTDHDNNSESWRPKRARASTIDATFKYVNQPGTSRNWTEEAGLTETSVEVTTKSQSASRKNKPSFEDLKKNCCGKSWTTTKENMR